jgi:NADH dehydrogenase
VSKHAVVIVGGGFAGAKAALELADDKNIRATLVSDRPDFQYYPALYRTATGGSRVLSTIPLDELFKSRDVEVVIDSLASLDREKKTIKTSGKKNIPYDSLVLALGVQTNYFGIPGLEEFSYGIKTVNDAERFKKHLHRQIVEEKKPDVNYVIIGGGPTGIEVAAELPAYIREICKNHGLKRPKLHVDLIEAAPRLLPNMSKDYSRAITKRLRSLGVHLYLGTAVQAQTADNIMVHDKRINSHTVVWTAGVTNHPFYKEHDFQLGPRGKVRVNQFLQAEKDIYVIGDNADTPYSGMAQTAIYDGKYIAHQLSRIAHDLEAHPYIAKHPVYVIPVGKRWAAVSWGSVRTYGLMGWFLRRMADLIGYHDYEPFFSAGTRWLHEDTLEDLCMNCSESTAS